MLGLRRVERAGVPAGNWVQKTIDVLVGLGVESAREKLARSEAVIRSQRRLGLKRKPPTGKFSHSLQFGVGSILS
jgi:hypothetical protein